MADNAADNKEVVVPKNPLEMSDEEMMALTPEAIAAMMASSTEGAETVQDAGAAGDGKSGDASATDGDNGSDTGDQGKQAQAAQAAAAVVVPPVNTDAKVDDANDKADDAKAAGAETDPAAAGKGKEADKPTDAATDPAGKAAADVKDGKADDKTGAATDKVDPEVKVIDYEAEYKRITSGFKANGRDFKVDNTDDAIALMQMGANYNQKMAALKPHLKMLKLLENNGLLDEAKLGFLIDLDKKNPDAINKLVKDSGIDPLDLSADKASAYKPGKHTVSDQEMELDGVLDEIKDSQHYTRTLQVVSSKWDGASKQFIAERPQILKVINGHMEAGIYDLVSAEVDREKAFGRLNGLTDLEAYQNVGDTMNARGDFNHLDPSKSGGTKVAAAPVVVEPKPKKEDDPSLKNKKLAASSAKPVVAPSAGAAKDFNPLALSDAEFTKQVQQKFL